MTYVSGYGDVGRLCQGRHRREDKVVILSRMPGCQIRVDRVKTQENAEENNIVVVSGVGNGRVFLGVGKEIV